jgi:hypothetical protein
MDIHILSTYFDTLVKMVTPVQDLYIDDDFIGFYSSIVIVLNDKNFEFIFFYF